MVNDEMMTMNKINKSLRKANRKNSVLYLFCNFISLMLITAYSAMMFSPTVLNILPEGGDSRKQVIAIFVLACFGCVVFTVYASNLFFRMKSKEIGIMMALGASRKRLAPGLFKEIAVLSGSSAAIGTLIGGPFAWTIWKLFSIFLVNTEEMKLVFDFKFLLVSLLFFILVMLSAFVMGIRYLNKTNIIDVVREERKREPIREVKRWFGPLGIAVLFIGVICGYFSTTVYMNLFSSYPGAWIHIFYAPVLIGLYMIVLHTVVHGFGNHKKRPYKDIISRSMMKFQGKQTVNNMLVITVLIAGACFGMFYMPMLSTGNLLRINSRPYNYSFHYPTNQTVIGKEEIKNIAGKYHLNIVSWKEAEYISLGMDGMRYVEDGNKFHYEYDELNNEVNVISEDSYCKMTGQSIDIASGKYKAVTNDDEVTMYLNLDGTKLTNMITHENISSEFDGILHYGLLSENNICYVIDNEDYNYISKGLTKEWQGNTVFFHVDGKDSYEFANELLDKFIDCFTKEAEIDSQYDRVYKASSEARGEAYWGDIESMQHISFDDRDSSSFRIWWAFMPKFSILDYSDFLNNFAVFLMMFLFIAIICMTAALVICYTRCITIAINNRYVFVDLKRLGASPRFLLNEVKSQASKVFLVPSVIGMTMMYLLYIMIMFGNDNKLAFGELIGLGACLLALALFGFIIYIVYRKTIAVMKKQLVD